MPSAGNTHRLPQFQKLSYNVDVRMQVVVCRSSPNESPRSELFFLKALGAFAAFGLFAQAPAPAALDTTPLSLKPEQYASTVANRQKMAATGESSSNESSVIVLEANKDMFTQDAWLGMQKYDPMILLLFCVSLLRLVPSPWPATCERSLLLPPTLHPQIMHIFILQCLRSRHTWLL